MSISKPVNPKRARCTNVMHFGLECLTKPLGHQYCHSERSEESLRCGQKRDPSLTLRVTRGCGEQMPTARAHRIRLNPTPTQVQYFLHAAGVARLAWNETLKAYQQAKAQGEKKTDWNVLKKQFRARIDTEFPFVRTVTKCAAEQAIADLRQAIATYYKTKQTVVGTSALRKLRFPGPRRRKKRIGGFGLANDKFHVDGHTVWVPRLGAVNMAEPL